MVCCLDLFILKGLRITDDWLGLGTLLKESALGEWAQVLTRESYRI
jgi:hypothetical protein